MNQKIKKVTKRLAIACLVAAAIGFTAFAQTSKPGQFKDTRGNTSTGGAAIVVPPKPGHVDATTFRVNRRPAIPFKSFQDPKTGKGIDPTGKEIALNTSITLPNRKTVSAKAYFDALDAVERKLNAQGFSLRNHEKRTLIEVVNPTPLLEKQKQAIMAMFKKPANNTALNLSDTQLLDKLQTETQQDNKKVYLFLQHALSKTNPVAVVGKYTTLEKSFNWQKDYGQVFGYFYAVAGGGVDLKSSTTTIGKTEFGTTNKVSGGFDALGVVFGQTGQMLHSHGSITTDAKGNTKLDLRVDVLGQTIYALPTPGQNDNVISAILWSKGIDRDLDWSATLPIHFGDVADVEAKIGVHGHAHAGIALAATTTNLSGQLGGSVDADVYCSAGIKLDLGGFDLIGVGVDLKMKLMDAGIYQYGACGLHVDSNNQLCLKGRAHIYGHLTLLSGHARVFLEIAGNEIGAASLWDNPGVVKASGDIVNEEVKPQCINFN